MTETQEFQTPGTLLAGDDAHEVCRECGADVMVPSFLAGKARAYGVMCSKCCDRDSKEATHKIIESSKTIRADRWRSICPRDYLETKAERLPRGNKLAEVLDWNFGARGLFLMGPTGTGKSRCAWLLLKREFLAGRSVRHVDYSAALEYASRYSESARDVQQWIERFCETELLLLDDVFKSKLSDSFESALFIIISRRIEKQLPLLLTANDSGASLKERMTQDRGPAMLRRLKEFCDVIIFGQS